MPPYDFEVDIDRPKTGRGQPDAHGQAALLLAESILHALTEKSVISTDDAISIVRIAAEVKVEVAALEGESEGRMQHSLNLLSAILRSFEAT